MANTNLYATLAEYKAYVVARGQTPTTDTPDDVTIVNLLETASRYLDDHTLRHYYPAIETLSYDVPMTRELKLRADLLEVITLTNGDGTAIASTDYILESANQTPYWRLRLRSTATTYWLPDTSNGTEQAIELVGWVGFRENYSQRAWKLAGTLGAAITDTTTLAFTMTAGHTLTPGHIVKIGTEIFNVDTVLTNAITPIVRGDNGSTAATHLINTPVYVWKPDELARDAVLDFARRSYKRRFGQSQGNESTIAPSGAVLPPKEIPASVNEFISTHKRRV
jgi:hypothetical protein